MNNISISKKSQLGIRMFLHYLFYHYVFFQIIGILRATAIYNTAYLANLSKTIIILFVSILFMLNIKNMKFRGYEIFFLLYPLLQTIYGVVNNGLNRNTISHLTTSIFFVILIIFIRNSDFRFTKNLQLKFANFMFWGLLISIITYAIAPLMGVKVYSVGVVSIFSLYPLIVFFQNKNKTKFLLTAILLILGGKRGVLLSGLLAFTIMALGQKYIKKSIRLVVLIITSILIISLFYISTTPERISLLPNKIKPMFYRMMYTNPFSEYNRIESDGRVMEVKSAMKPLKEEPKFIFMGRGVGYSYEYLDIENNFISIKHNTHFSPVAILSRFGIIYTIILYTFIINIIYKNFKKMKQNKLPFELSVLLIYVIASFINSFTAFTIYTDYLFILSLGLLSSNSFYKNYEISK